MDIQKIIRYLQSSINSRSNSLSDYWNEYELSKQLALQLDDNYWKNRVKFWKKHIHILEVNQKLEKKMIAHFIDYASYQRDLDKLCLELS